MALKGELKGLDGTTCSECGAELILSIQRSGAGWYLGYFCGHCGPCSRETGYFATREKAAVALNAYLEDCRKPMNLRNTNFTG